MRDWPPCPPIQRDSGRRSRPGVNPFISALTVARCPATFPGVWPQLRDTLSTSWSVGRGTGAFIYLPPFSENRPIFCSFPFAKIQPVFLPEQKGFNLVFLLENNILKNYYFNYLEKINPYIAKDFKNIKENHSFEIYKLLRIDFSI